jgi:arylsulfatase A-like enzyme
MGHILATLDEVGLTDDTLVVFTTDHGIAFPGSKATLYDPGIEIALLMRGPGGFNGGKLVDALLINNDFLPTVLDVCDVTVPAQVQGRSMLPLVHGELGKLHDRIFVEQTYHAAYDPLRGLRTERYKYIRSYEERPFWFPPNVDNGFSKEVVRRLGYFDISRPAEMLFDLEVDSLERNNLVSDPDYAEILERMRANLERWMRNTNDPLLTGYVPPHPGAYVTPADSYDP